MAVQLIHKNSSVEDRRPQASQLTSGELSVNFNEAGPFLCCKDTAGNIQQLGGIKFNPDVPADAVIGTWWFNTATETLYVWNGSIWHQISNTGGGGGSGITEILGDDGIDAFVNGSIVTLNVDLAPSKGLYFEADRLAINPGANLSFDAQGKLRADIASVSFKGTIDLTTDPVVTTPSLNDVYINSVVGTLSSVWQAATGEGAIVIKSGDQVLYGPSGWSFVPSPVTPTDLSVAGVTANQLEVVSSTGTDAVLTGATNTEAGLMTAADKISLGTWDRTGTVISPSNTGDDVSITGTVTATSFAGDLATTNLTGTITNAQLAGSITNDKLAGSITNDKLAGSITNDKLAGSISDDKLASTFLKNVSEDTTPQLGGSLDVNGNSIVSVSNGNITLAPNGTGEVDIDSTTAIIVPVGTEAQRPATPEAGMIRFNSDTDKYESYDGTDWGSLVGGDIGTAPENIPVNGYLGKLAFVDEVATLRPYFPTGSFYSAPQTGGDIQFRYVSDTEVQLVMKGLDGTIRSSVVALETSVNTWTPTAFTIGSQSPTITSATITRLGTTAILTINFGGSQTYADGDIVSITGLPVNGDGTGVLAGRNSGAGGATVQGNLLTAGTNAYGKVSYASGSINLGRVTLTVTGV
jgi:hypothetical protein